MKALCCMFTLALCIQNYATWNLEPLYEGGLIPLPYTRPCKHTCEAVADACSASDPYAVSAEQDFPRVYSG